MAKFNFIAGGYYGKLGETVGQRWRNERLVRTYTKPSNPQSGKQTENRRLFSLASRAATIAMQMNGGDKRWASQNQNEFARRIAAAREMLDETEEFARIIPLLPYGTLADEEVSTELTISGSTVTYHAYTETNLQNVPVAVFIQAKNIETEEYDSFTRRGVITGSPGDWTFDISIPVTHTFDETCMTTAISFNEGEQDNPIVYLAPQIVIEGTQTIYLRITNVAVTHAASGVATVTVTLDNEVDVPIDAQPMLISGYYEKQGTTEQFSFSENVLPSGNTFSFQIGADNDALGQPLRFSTTNQISFEGAEWIGATKTFIMEATTENIASDDKRSDVYTLVVPSAPSTTTQSVAYNFASSISFSAQTFAATTNDPFFNKAQMNFDVAPPNIVVSGNSVALGNAATPLSNYAFGNGELTPTNAVTLSATANGLPYQLSVATIKFASLPQSVEADGLITSEAALEFEEDENTASTSWGFLKEEDVFPIDTYTFGLTLSLLQSLLFYGDGNTGFEGTSQANSVQITDVEFTQSGTWKGELSVYFRRNYSSSEYEEFDYYYYKPQTGRIALPVTHNATGKTMTLTLEYIPDNRYW